MGGFDEKNRFKIQNHRKNRWAFCEQSYYAFAPSCRTWEIVKSLPLTVVELKYMCDDLIKKGYGEKPVLLSNDTAESGYHGMYYGFGPEDEYEDYVKIILLPRSIWDTIHTLRSHCVLCTQNGPFYAPCIQYPHYPHGFWVVEFTTNICGEGT